MKKKVDNFFNRLNLTTNFEILVLTLLAFLSGLSIGWLLWSVLL